MAGIGIKILVGDTTGSNRAEKGKRRQMKTRRRTKKRRRRATVWRTGEVARGEGGPRGGMPGIRGVKGGALRARRLRGGVPEVWQPRKGAPGVGRPASWSASTSLSSSASWSACWRVFALAMQVFALAARFWRCFSLFGRRFFSRKFSYSSLLSSTTAIASATILSSQSKPVDPVQSLPSAWNLVFGVPLSKNLIGSICM